MLKDYNIVIAISRQRPKHLLDFIMRVTVVMIKYARLEKQPNFKAILGKLSYL